MFELYEILAASIILKAVTDYKLFEQKANNAKNEEIRRNAIRELQSIEEFFLSDRFKLYSTLNGRDLLNAIKRMPSIKSPRDMKKCKLLYVDIQ